LNNLEITKTDIYLHKGFILEKIILTLVWIEIDFISFKNLSYIIFIQENSYNFLIEIKTLSVSKKNISAAGS